MNNKIVIITGANTGIGLETAKNLVLRGKQCSTLNSLFADYVKGSVYTTHAVTCPLLSLMPQEELCCNNQSVNS